MPIMVGMAIIQSQLSSAFNMAIAGKPDLTSVMMTAAVASAVPMAMLPMTPPIPLAPVGFSATQSMLSSAFNMGVAGKPGMMATMIATAYSVLAPMCPPTGLAILQSMLSSAFSMDLAGKPDLMATMIASAICTYFTCGPTI
jgi:hypothetical protein